MSRIDNTFEYDQLWRELMGKEDSHWEELDLVLWRSQAAAEEKQKRVKQILKCREDDIHSFFFKVLPGASSKRRTEFVEELSKRSDVLIDLVQLKTPLTEKQKSVPELALGACPELQELQNVEKKSWACGLLPLELLKVETRGTMDRVRQLKSKLAGLHSGAGK